MLGGPPALAAGHDLPSFERGMGEVEALLRGADFEGAIRRAEKLRPLGRDVPRGPDTLKMRARLEVLLSSAQVALGDRSAARASMKRAIYLWPLLSLDERETSPRVLKVFEAVRGKSAPAKGGR
jgi:hypothetical protein